MGYLILKDYFLNRLNNARGKLWLLIAAVLTLISLVLHLGFLWQPSETVFDEVHFGRFASAYFTGAYYFDIHPPLGKLLIALGAFLGGYLQYVQDYGVFDFENIGEPYGQAPFVWFRVLPALAGSLIPLAVFCFARSLGLNQRASLLVMFGLVFENALLAHTRLALLDAFLLVFGFAGLALFFFARNHGYSLWPLLLAGFSLSLSFSTKWTGLSFFGLAGLVMFYDFVKGRRKQVNSSRSVFLAKFFLVMVAVPLAVYYSVFVAHFRLLPDNGPGMPYMTSDFRQGKLSLPQKFIELKIGRASCRERV